MLDENDLVKIFSNRKKGTEIVDLVLRVMTKFLFFSLAVCASYVFLNFYGIKDNIIFWYKNDFKAGQSEKAAINNSEPTVNQIIDIANNKKPTVVEKKVIQPDMVENSVRIPTIGIDAPILWRVNNLANEVSAGLSKGLIHVNGTALPGERGNVYITGHSSNYVWVRQKYNSIFSNIGKLVAGDIIYVKFGSQVFVYKVFDQKVIGANDLSILNPTNDSRLTLATCWPLGTSLKRMVVFANQIYPNPDKNKPSKEVVQFTKLPAGR